MFSKQVERTYTVVFNSGEKITVKGYCIVVWDDASDEIFIRGAKAENGTGWFRKSDILYIAEVQK